MERRDCTKVITAMLMVVPEAKTELKKALEWNFNDAQYKAPEENIQWHRTMQTLVKHIPAPAQDWEFTVLSIFTMRTVEELRRVVALKN